MLTESTCRNCGEHIIRGPVPGDPTVDGWYHHATRSELCGAVNDADDDRVAEPAFTVAEAIERLDASYELVYVNYDDRLTDEQISALVRGDMDSVYELLDDWEFESRHYGVTYVIDDAFSKAEWGSLTPDEQDEVRDEIQERDTSNPLADLIRHTPDPLLRINVVSEDDAWSFEEVSPEDVLTAVGLDATEHNKSAVDYVLANASPEFSVLLGYWIVSVDLQALAAIPYDVTAVKITNPHLYLGNPMSGSGFVSEDALEGVVTVARADLRTDKDAFGYAVDEIYGGLNASAFKAEIQAVEGDAEVTQ